MRRPCHNPFKMHSTCPHWRVSVFSWFYTLISESGFHAFSLLVYVTVCKQSPLLGVFTWLSFGIWIRVSDAFSVPMLKSEPEKCVFTNTVYLRCIWKWIRIRDQNCAPESRHAKLYRVKVIKMSRISLSHSMVASRVSSLLQNRLWNRLRNLLSLDAQDKRTTPLHLKPLRFSTAPIRSHLTFFFCVWPRSRELTYCELTQHRWFLITFQPLWTVSLLSVTEQK